LSKSKVIVVRTPKVFKNSKKVDFRLVEEMVKKVLSALTGEKDPRDALFHFYRPSDSIGIKVNCLGGEKVATSPEVVYATFNLFRDAGFDDKRFLVWDRSDRELKEAGFSLNSRSGGLKCYGTDSGGVGYDSDFITHRDVGSLLTRIMTDRTTLQLNMPILKDHTLAGVTCALKNFFGAIHNPNKYHDNGCDPFVADLNFIPRIRKQQSLIVADALRIQYHGGPAYHPQWYEDYGAIIAGTDPVAVDFVGLQIIDRIRKKHNLPSLEKAGRKPNYIFTAADSEHSLGNAKLADIDLVEINL
jgi:uncharacterized protein (DUF362 family)